MEVFDVLILGAELSMALAGFAGIIATFQFREGGTIRRADAVGLTMIVTYSLLAALQCGVILVFNVIGLEEAALWALGSALASVINLVNLISFYSNMKGAIRNKRLLAIMWVLQCVSVVIAMSNVLNVFGIVFDRVPGPILVNVVWGLVLAGWMFSRLLLIPVWRTLYRQEASEVTI